VLEREGDVEISSSPPSERSRRIPKEIRATLRALPRSEPLEEGTARQLGVVLGASTPHLSAAFCRDLDPVEVLLIGWQGDAALTDAGVQLVAHAVAAGHAALRSRREAVETQMLKERTRWAYEIHDGLTQVVTTAVLELEAIAHKIQRDPQEAIDTLTTTKTEIRKALSELRGLLFEIHREQEKEERADEPLTKYVQDVVRRWRLPARITVKGDLHHVPKPLLGAAYVVIREALANAAKHASARSVTVWVSATAEEMVVEVEDTGRGFTASQGARASERHHFGLEMMKKRVAEVGGTLDVQSQPGRGTQVVARLPIRSRGSRR
jgi:signal transduction histidine kinase